MNKEEIEELKDFTIDLTDIDELALGLEVCSKKSNIVIQEFANLIIELEQENKKYKEKLDCDLQWAFKYDKQLSNWNKLKEYIRKNIIYDDVGMKILDPSSLEDYIQELEQGSDE